MPTFAKRGPLTKTEPPDCFDGEPCLDVDPIGHEELWRSTTAPEYYLWMVLTALSEPVPEGHPLYGRVYYTQKAIAQAAQRSASRIARLVRALESKHVVRRAHDQHGPYIEILAGLARKNQHAQREAKG